MIPLKLFSFFLHFVTINLLLTLAYNPIKQSKEALYLKGEQSRMLAAKRTELKDSKARTKNFKRKFNEIFFAVCL